MRELLAKAEAGTLPEKIAHDLAQATLHGVYAAPAIVTALVEGAEADDKTLLGLEHVLEQARKAASDLVEVLQDASRGAAPLKLQLGPAAEASDV
jgi:hypothetical protein